VRARASISAALSIARELAVVAIRIAFVVGTSDRYRV
jgi:hypothetical protein